MTRRSLYHHLVRDLAGRILGGELPPGQRLETEHQLCERYGVSRTVVRDALRVLAEKGLVTARPRVGTLVNGIEAWNFLDPDLVQWAQGEEVQGRFFEALVETRHILEPAVVERAALRATDEDLQRIQAAFDALQAATDAEPQDLEGFNQADIEFHQALFDATHNVILRQFGGLVRAALLAGFESALMPIGISRASVEAHGRIVEAIRERDPAKARHNLEIAAGILSERLVGSASRR